MNLCLLRFLQVLLLVSLMAMPSQAASVSVVEACPVKMACCGPTCPCPTGKTCMAAPAPADDRAIGQAQSQVSGRVMVPLYPVNFELKAPSTISVKLALIDTQPPWALGSPPQATLRVWLL